MWLRPVKALRIDAPPNIHCFLTWSPLSLSHPFTSLVLYLFQSFPFYPPISCGWCHMQKQTAEHLPSAQSTAWNMIQTGTNTHASLKWLILRWDTPRHACARTGQPTQTHLCTTHCISSAATINDLNLVVSYSTATDCVINNSIGAGWCPSLSKHMCARFVCVFDVLYICMVLLVHRRESINQTVRWSQIKGGQLLGYQLLQSDGWMGECVRGCVYMCV